MGPGSRRRWISVESRSDQYPSHKRPPALESLSIGLQVSLLNHDGSNLVGGEGKTNILSDRIYQFEIGQMQSDLTQVLTIGKFNKTLKYS